MNYLYLTLAVLAAGFLLGCFLKKTVRRLLHTALLLALVMVAVGTAIVWSPPENQPLDPDYAVVLGVGLEDGQATEELERRLELGLSYLQTSDGLLILSGGDPDGDGITEAQVMAQWMEDHGADLSRVHQEDRSTDTRENLLYARTLAQSLGAETDTVLILTSDYHQTRAQYLARAQGQEAVGLACETPPLQRLTASVREVYAFVKAWAESRLSSS